MGERQAEGLRVLVTAGAAGIGGAITAAFVAAGARVHVCDVSEQVLAACRAAMPDVGATLADVSDEVAVDRLFADVQERLGGLDVLVNNAGIAGPTGAIEDFSRGVAALHRHRFDRAVFMRAPGRADDQGGRRGLDRQHVVVGWPLRLCLPHAICGGEMGRGRVDAESC